MQKPSYFAIVKIFIKAFFNSLILSLTKLIYYIIQSLKNL